MRRAAAGSIAFVLATSLLAGSQTQQPPSGPPTATDADDPYLWLEDVHGAKPLAWAKERTDKARAVLSARPRFQKDYDELLAMQDATDRIPDAVLDHGFAFNFWQDAQHPKGVWRRAAIDAYAQPDVPWEVLLDVDRLAEAEKENWVWKGAECAPSRPRCLVQLSRGGGDAKVVREFDLASKTFPADGFSLPEALTEASYVDDDSLLVTTNFGPGTLADSGYPRIAKLWTRGQPLAAAVTVAEGRPTDVGMMPAVCRSSAGTYAMVTRAPSFFENEYFLIAKGHSSRRLPLPSTAEIRAVVQGQIVFKVRKPWAPTPEAAFEAGSLLAFPLDRWIETDTLPPVSVLYAPSARTALQDVAQGRDAVYVAILDNVIGSVHAYRPQRTDRPERTAWKDEKLALPSNGSATIVSADSYGPDAFVRFQSFLVPPTVFATRGTEATVAVRSLKPQFDSSPYVTEQFTATSSDGTQVPYFVVRARARQKPGPTLLVGYGGFEVSPTPSYLETHFRLWLLRGGSLAFSNIRGGGEFGPAWHEAAVGVNRQRSFDDFAAIARKLVTQGVTTPKQLGILGGSNGGLLVATTMTQQPDLVGAVVALVPLTDMLRYTKIGVGAGGIGEYGDPADPKVAAALRAYSPYQNVQAGRRYPPILFVTSTSDDRVTPAHARKMAARMEAQGHDVLFYENVAGGHDFSDRKQAAETAASIMSFLSWKLGPVD